MRVPVINNQQQPMFDVTQAVQKKCECGSDHFAKFFKIGLISRFFSGNKTNQDIIIEAPVYGCCNCGKEFNVIDNVADNEISNK